MRLHAILTSALLCSLASASPSHLLQAPDKTAPIVTVKNGTYHGSYNPTYNTDHFLGIPFAHPPVGNLRFCLPQPLNTSWTGIRNATEYGYECMGYGRDTWSQGNYVSEDCLTLNVIRSRGSGRGKKLPVLFWIHGGGGFMGGSADHRYNQSFIVQQAAADDMPIIAVSINYRLFSLGLHWHGNAWLQNRRLALRWIQENIECFGGDKTRVTIQGESAGAGAVGTHTLAYRGRDEGLFAQAIAQSGFPGPAAPGRTIQEWDSIIANISAGVGCQSTASVLDCLRTVPVDHLSGVINSKAISGAFGGVVDGDFITGDLNAQLETGQFIHVPLLVVCNTDEGTSNATPMSMNTSADFAAYIAAMGYDNGTVQDLEILYPDIPEIGNPATLRGRPDVAVGLQYKRSSALNGDMRAHWKHRFVAQSWAKAGVQVFSYRFNALVNGFWYTEGSQHFVEVAFVFHNTDGLGYPQNGRPNPMGGVEREKYIKLSRQMTRAWISFVNYGHPNGNVGNYQYWPAYTLEDPQNFVFEQNFTSRAEPDFYRAEGIRYLTQLALARKGTNCTGLTACG